MLNPIFISFVRSSTIASCWNQVWISQLKNDSIFLNICAAGLIFVQKFIDCKTWFNFDTSILLAFTKLDTRLQSNTTLFLKPLKLLSIKFKRHLLTFSLVLATWFKARFGEFPAASSKVEKMSGTSAIFDAIVGQNLTTTLHSIFQSPIRTWWLRFLKLQTRTGQNVIYCSVCFGKQSLQFSTRRNISANRILLKFIFWRFLFCKRLSSQSVVAHRTTYGNKLHFLKKKVIEVSSTDFREL